MIDPRRSVLVSVLIVAAVYLVTLGLVERRGLWITDNANKFLQVRATLTGSPLDLSIPWPGDAIDPEFAFNPLPAPFSHVEDGRLYSQYPPFFAVISAAPYRLLGFTGLYAIPLLSSILMLVFVAGLARQVGLGPVGRHVAVLLAGLCTPVWFYAVVFWEHASAACLFLGSVHCCLLSREKGRDSFLAIGSALAAFGAFFRDEALLCCAIVCAFAFFGARKGRFRRISIVLGTMVAMLALLAWFQWTTIGAPLGYHVRANLGDLGHHFVSRIGVFYRLLLASHPNLATSLAVTAPFVILLAWNPRPVPRVFRWALPVAAVFASAAASVSLVGFLSSPGPIQHLLQSNSLFPAAPIVLLALMGRRDDETRGEFETRWLRVFVLAYTALYLVAAPSIASRGIHWGNRFLFPLYPLLAVLAARNIVSWFGDRPRRWGWAAVALASTVVVSAAAQGYSIHLLNEKKDFSYRLNRELERREEAVVVSDVWWAPQAMFDEFFDRPVFYVRSRSQLDRLRRRILQAGHDRFLFVTTAAGVPKSGSTVVVDDGDLEFFSLALRGAPAGRP